MWLRIIVFLLILSAIDDYWEEKIKKQRGKKRAYRLLKCFAYFSIAVLLLIIANFFAQEAYIYMTFSALVGVGTFLSAINPNLREMYITMLVSGTVIGIVSFYYEKHRIIFTLVDIRMLLSIIAAIKEGIHNMRFGIDPDVIAEQKAAERRFKQKIKLFRTVFKIWRWW